METMGFLGPVGTHSEAAACYLNNMLERPCRMEGFPTIYAVIQAVAEGKLDTCLVPVENSLEGSINITLDALAHSDSVVVERELVWSVHNQLMVKDTGVPVRRILSHAQPLAQCRDYLRDHFPDAQLEAVASTAFAAKRAAEGKPSDGLAAICTRKAGELNGLVTLAEEIQDNHTNCTRFYQLRRKGCALDETEAQKALVICQIDGKNAGRLCEVLQELAKRNVNLTRIESRPARTGLGEYIFFFDVDLPKQIEDFHDAIEAVKRRSIWVRNPGRFPVIRADRMDKDDLSIE